MAREHHLTFGDRIRWLGWLSWMTIGILALASTLIAGAYLIVFRSPITALIAPVAIAFVVVYLLNPVVTTLERRGVRRGLGVALIYVAFLAVVGTALAFLIPLVARQLTAFIEELPTYATKVIAEINEFAAKRGLATRINLTSEEIVQYIEDNRGTIVSLLGGVRSFAGQILHILITLVVGIILSIYFLLDLPKIQRGFRGVLPEESRDEWLEVFDKIGQALGGFFRGQLLVALFVGVASALGLSLIKLPFAILIGLIAGIFNLVPLIGPFLAAIPMASVAILSGDPEKALWGAIVLLVVQQIDNHIVSPNVMGRTVRLHPVTVMLALLAGAGIAGILGMLVVIPTVAAGKIVILHLWSKREAVGLGEVDLSPEPDPEGDAD